MGTGPAGIIAVWMQKRNADRSEIQRGKDCSTTLATVPNPCEKVTDYRWLANYAGKRRNFFSQLRWWLPSLQSLLLNLPPLHRLVPLSIPLQCQHICRFDGRSRAKVDLIEFYKKARRGARGVIRGGGMRSGDVSSFITLNFLSRFTYWVLTDWSFSRVPGV